MSDREAFLEEALEERKQNYRFRSLSPLKPSGIIVNKEGNSYIDFSSNDYLGLAGHPDIIQKSEEYLQAYGAGSRASRLISGTYEIHSRLEEQFAGVFDSEAALLFNSGFQANSTILGTVTSRHSLILADKLSHSSLLQGSLSSRADFQRFSHNDTVHLRALLQKAQEQNYDRIWIITESIFSMNGDRSPLNEISALAEEFDAWLFVDDAHAAGVWGEKGLGLAKNIPNIDILLGTCGKAFGSFGAYVICSQKMKEYLVNFCPGFIYTTALPPAVIGATRAALDLIPTLQEEREKFHQNIEFFCQSARELGFDTGLSSTQIIPLIVGDDQEALQLSDWLRENGILATAIRPPTVPREQSRIRVSLSSRHTKKQLKKFLNTLKNWNHE
ncbi:MAG TPA: 8-amino-7-oxononanoate synthase [Balneolaceae bacterium]|nr:8-amino-7-oxononanoate synthase [Balneolaceae bacterium]